MPSSTGSSNVQVTRAATGFSLFPSSTTPAQAKAGANSQ